MMIKFNAKKLAAVSIAIYSGEARHYLRGVYFEGNRAVATDGHILTIAQDETSIVEAPGIYPITPKARTAMKNTKADTVQIAHDVLTVYDGHQNALYMEPCPKIDETYPNYRKVVPSIGDTQASYAAVSPIVMKDIADTALILCSKHNKAAPFALSGASESDVHVVRYHNTPGVFSVVMPCPRDGVPKDVPAWFSKDAKDNKQ
ncbi:MAG: hypothetical protein V3R83_12390 [Gammaproteobacteria bacterium]